MDERLWVRDEPRPGAADDLAEMPLLTVAWRELRAGYRDQRDQRRLLLNVLAEVAVEAHRLRRGTRAGVDREQTGRSALVDEMASAADRLERILAGAGVTVVAPEGEPFTAELMELFDNVAQVPVAGAPGPRVAEVLTPAVFTRGELLRMGSVVVAVPTAAEEQPDAANTG